jgi:hypothetical protein
MRRIARVDGNHEAIVSCFRAAGCSVQSLAQVGDGCPDLLVGINGINVLVEVKDSTQPPSRRLLTLAQLKWHDEWRGWVHVVTTIDKALLLVNFYRKQKAG